MTTVQSKVTDGQDLIPFFYLRISGLPYYFFASIDPANSAYGAFAWSAPNGYFDATGWHRGGLMLPDDTIEQKFADIIGGIATPGRIRLSIIDFPAPGFPGYGFFSRLFSPGRALTDTSVQKAPLLESITVDSTEISVRDKAATFTADSDVYLGAETIAISSVSGPDSDGVSVLTISARNKYACFGNTQDNPDTAFPPIPYHRIALDPSGAQSAGAIVSSDPVTVIGRLASLWMGHMRPDGNPEPESSSACILLGRITNLDIGKVGGVFDVTLTSITGDLQTALVAPDLASTTVSPGIYLSDERWRTFDIHLFFTPLDGTDFISDSQQTITVAAGMYTAEALAGAINEQIQAISTGDARLDAVWQCVSFRLGLAEDGLPHFQFHMIQPTGNTVSDFGAVVIDPFIQGGSSNAIADIFGVFQEATLLTAMGFGAEFKFSVPYDQDKQQWILTAEKPAADMFLPTTIHASETIVLGDPVASDFFLDQLDGSAKAYVRFGDGQIVELLDRDTGDNTLTIGNAFTNSANSSSKDLPGYYYVSIGGIPTIEQVAVITDDPKVSGGHGLFLGRLLASTTGQTTGSLNVFPEGVGLGWLALLTESEWLVEFETGVQRIMFIDRAVKFGDLFAPISREHGLFICWDPSGSKVRLLRMKIPQAANAASLIFSESNRAKEDDRTTQRLDLTSLRTSWKIQGGWDWASQKFTQGPIVINDVVARSNYPNNARQESIEDRTLVRGAQLGDAIAQRLQLYGSAWTMCERSMNKRGMLLYPGTVHQVVDNTMVNPYTGASGITSADAVYCFLVGVSSNPSTGETTVTFMVNSADDQSLYRPWSPVGLIDFDNNSGGYAHGYNSSTKTLAMLAHYGSGNDALDFVAADKVRIVVRDMVDAGPPYEYTDVVASVGATTITLTTGLGGALSTTIDSIVMLQDYGNQTTDRKSGTHKVAFQGNGTTRLIDAVAGARLYRWS